jgi:hypothetical protein
MEHQDLETVNREPESPVRRTSPMGDRIEHASDNQLLKRIVRATEWTSVTVLRLLRQRDDSSNVGTESSSPRPTVLDLDPYTRTLIPGPGLADYTPEERQDLALLAVCARNGHIRSTSNARSCRSSGV